MRTCPSGFSIVPNLLVAVLPACRTPLAFERRSLRHVYLVRRPIESQFEDGPPRLPEQAGRSLRGDLDLPGICLQVDHCRVSRRLLARSPRLSLIALLPVHIELRDIGAGVLEANPAMLYVDASADVTDQVIARFDQTSSGSSQPPKK